MPSSIGHLIAGSSIGYAFYNGKKDYKYWLIIILLSVIPDIDVLFYDWGVYSPVFSHRGITHSLLFAFILSFMFMVILRQKIFSKASLLTFLVFVLVASSHPLLDAMTNGGSGIGLFLPFDDNRYFLPWKIIMVSPLRLDQFFSQRGWWVLESELWHIGVPSVILIVIVSIFRIILKKSPHKKILLHVAREKEGEK